MSTGTGLNVSKAVGYAVLTNNTGLNVTKALGYAVLDTSSAPVWPLVSAPSGYVGLAYSWSFTVTGASTVTVLSGSLPPGLAIAGAPAVTISGTPTAAGVYSFTLRATNSQGTADKSFSITISTTPTGGAWTFCT